MIERLQIGSSRRLLATQSGEPDAVVVEASKERFDFPHSAATVRGVLIQDSKLRLLLRHCLFGRKVDQVEVQSLRHLVAIGVGLGEAITGFEKKHVDALLICDDQAY